jgi:hypothetical protein
MNFADVIKFDEAILSLRPNSSGKYHTSNGAIITWYDTETTQPSHDEIIAEIARLEQQKEINAQAAAAAKESAIAKLSALGLTADEIAHLIP